MHELPITQNILDIVLRHAEQAGATSVTDINIVIGRLSSVIDDSIQFYWGLIAKDTIAEGAVLHFRRIQPMLKCKECGTGYDPGDVMMPCPQCNSLKIEIVAGNEFFLESINVETEINESKD
jgi:hydrogenase nickel incorporation protein HypA/HybF